MPGNDDNVRVRVADLIDRAVDGQLELGALRPWQEEAVTDPDVGVALHALDHYLVDSDIVSRDESYREWHETQLREMAALLRKGDPLPVEMTKALEPRPKWLLRLLSAAASRKDR